MDSFPDCHMFCILYPVLPSNLCYSFTLFINSVKTRLWALTFLFMGQNAERKETHKDTHKHTFILVIS